MSMQDALSQFRAQVGQQSEVGDWIEVTQEMVNDFAEITRDRQWIHTDPERAAQFSPFGTTVAHGFLTLSLIPALTSGESGVGSTTPGVKLAVNYGLNRVRFPQAVVSGSRVRAHSTIVSVDEAGDSSLQLVRRVTVEIQGKPKPACVADTVTRLYF